MLTVLGGLAEFERDLIRTRTDELSLELGEPAEHGKHQPAVRCGGIGPCISKRAETGLAFRNGGQSVQ